MPASSPILHQPLVVASDTSETMVQAIKCLFRCRTKKRKSVGKSLSLRASWKLRMLAGVAVSSNRRRGLSSSCASSKQHYNLDGLWRRDDNDDASDDDLTDCSSDDGEQEETVDDATSLLNLIEDPQPSVQEGILIDLDSNQNHPTDYWRQATDPSTRGNILFDNDMLRSMTTRLTMCPGATTTTIPTASTSTPKSQRRVHFNPDNVVSAVYEIPSRHSYTFEEKRLIWSDMAVICANARRNVKEWRFEGCDWVNAFEEDQFQADVHGTLVHPAHWRACPV